MDVNVYRNVYKNIYPTYKCVYLHAKKLELKTEVKENSSLNWNFNIFYNENNIFKCDIKLTCFVLGRLWSCLHITFYYEIFLIYKGVESIVYWISNIHYPASKMTNLWTILIHLYLHLLHTPDPLYLDYFEGDPRHTMSSINISVDISKNYW